MKEIDYKAIGARIKYYRNQRNITQAQHISNKELNHILSDCSDKELKAIIEMVKSTKSILRK